nr:hypothetical protein [Allomuricauda sp.]
MDEKKTTPRLIDELIDSVSEIESVNTPPFFRDKVLKRLEKAQESEAMAPFLFGFTPKLQIAALLVFAMLNIGALWYYQNQQQQEELQTFAEAYGLSLSEESILN